MRRRRAPRAFSSTATVLLLLLSTLMTWGGCADRLILIPSTDPRDPRSATRAEIHAGNETVEIFKARSRGAATSQPVAFVLEFTGNGTRAEDITSWVAQRWGERPVEVWCPNYPGYGRSSGRARLRSIPGAMLAVFDELSREANGRPIIVGGHSIGTVSALHIAANRPVAGVFLHNPPPLRSLILGKHGWWNAWLLALPAAMQIPGEMDSIANAKRCRAPALCVTGRHDTWIDPKYQRLIYNAYAGSKRLMEYDGDHNTPPEQAGNEFERHLEWLWRQSVGRR